MSNKNKTSWNEGAAAYSATMLGAAATSRGIPENQLANAERIAREYGWDNIEFICSDTINGFRPYVQTH